jgi:replication-associated recombination protein RarA
MEKNKVFTRKKRLKRQTVGMKIDMSHVKARIDTGLKLKTRNRHIKSKTQVAKLDLPPLMKISDLVALGKKISAGSKYKRINNAALGRSHRHLDELDKLIGLEKLKSTVFDQVVYFLQDLDKITNDEYLHTILTGPPGVGKTTVARILGKIYASMGVIENPKNIFKIAHREDLVASYLGQTATKTLALLQSCIGGVLFIDEVYSLGTGVSGKDSFSKEAVDTLCGFLSENAGKFICIIAGYEKEVERCFFNINKGLKSRFQWAHQLDPFTSDQISSIFLLKVEKIGWKTQDSSRGSIVDVIIKNYEVFENGQGRAVQNFLFKCKIAHAKRLLCDAQAQPGTINKKDVENALKTVENNKDDVCFLQFTGMFI